MLSTSSLSAFSSASTVQPNGEVRGQQGATRPLPQLLPAPVPATPTQSLNRRGSVLDITV